MIDAEIAEGLSVTENSSPKSKEVLTPCNKPRHGSDNTFVVHDGGENTGRFSCIFGMYRFSVRFNEKLLCSFIFCCLSASVMTMLVGLVYKFTAERAGRQSLDDLMKSSLYLMRSELREIPPHDWART